MPELKARKFTASLQGRLSASRLLVPNQPTVMRHHQDESSIRSLNDLQPVMAEPEQQISPTSISSKGTWSEFLKRMGFTHGKTYADSLIRFAHIWDHYPTIRRITCSYETIKNVAHQIQLSSRPQLPSRWKLPNIVVRYIEEINGRGVFCRKPPLAGLNKMVLPHLLMWRCKARVNEEGPYVAAGGMI